MNTRPVFEGLVIDEYDHPVSVSYVGDEPCYVVNDAGFLRHIPSEQVDRQVFDLLRKQIEGNEGLLSEQAAKMLGQEDLFSRAIIESQFKNLDKQFQNLLQIGIPEEARAYMGMIGFRVKINVHGEVLDVEQPGTTAPEDK